MDSAMPAAPRSTAGIAKERAQRLYMERDLGPLPPARHDTGEVLGNHHRRHCGQWYALWDQPGEKGFQRTFAVDSRGIGEPSLLFEKGQELLQVMVVRRRLILFGEH